MELRRYKPAWQFDEIHADIFNRYTQSIVLSDVDGRQADNVRIKLVGINASGLPKINDRFTLAIGYVDGDKQQLFDKGRYIISRPKVSLMSGIVTINGTAAPFKLNNETEFEKKRTRTFQGKTVSEIFKTLAEPHGYTALVAGDFAQTVIDQFEQDDSDHATILKLANQFDAIAKPIDRFSNQYVMIGKGSSLTIKEKPKIERQYSLNPNRDIHSLELTKQSRDQSLGVKAYWQCVDKKTRIPVTVGEAPFKELGQFSTVELARQQAASELRRIKREGQQIQCKVIGDPELVAEGIATFDETFPTQYQGRWSIDQVVHRLTPTSYTTEFTATSLAE